MKRIFTLVLAVLLVLGCTTFAMAEESKSLSVITVAAGAAFPDGVTVSDSDYLLKIEELTGFDLEWTNFNDSSADGVRLLLSSGNSPDLVQIADTGIIPELALAGAITPLNDALAEKGQDLTEFLPQEVLDGATIDGNIYFLPRYTGGAQIGTMAIRKDVLDELNLTVPKTIDEWESVLAAVKENTELIPLMVNSSISSFMNFATAFGADHNRSTFFYVVDGECQIPMLGEKGLAFVAKMNEWYNAGYIDREFLITDGAEVTSNFFAGNGFAMFMDYTQVARQLPAFYEKNPDGEILLIDPPVGENGESGYTADGTTSMAWFVPATSADKVELAVEFLNACLDEDVLNLICYGIEGENWEYVDGVPTFIEGSAPVDYRGYYSRVVLDRTWDVAWEASMGLTEVVEQVQGYRKFNDILYIPVEGVEAYSENNSAITSYINSEIIRMIAEGADEEMFSDLYAEVMDMGGQEVIDQVNAWLASK